MTKTKIVENWEAECGNHTMYGQTKEELLKRAAKDIEKREKEGLSWELKHVFRTVRTKPFPIVLVIGSDDNKCGRPADKWVETFNKKEMRRFGEEGKKAPRLVWVDSAGTRSVFWYTESQKYSPDYETDAIDLPVKVFEALADYLKVNGVDKQVHLFNRIEDPGQGIMLKEDTPENGFSYREDN